MTQLSKEDVQQLAHFARIALSDEEAEIYTGKINELIGFAETLKAIDTKDVQPMTHPLPQYNVLREDVPTDRLDREEMLKNVKEHEEGMIKVPTII